MLLKSLFVLLFCFCFTPWASPPMALLAGALFSLLWGNPFSHYAQSYSKKMLQWSIIGLGFGLNARSALAVSKDGFFLTIATIALVFLLAYLGNKLFKVEKNTARLIASGTAICGGSAIAAVAPVIKAKPGQISIAIGTVFILNAVALFVFPVVGHYFGLSQYQFGLWSAIAIHDTSSVVGAAQAYGEEALQMATTVKLSRALWIIPLSLSFALIYKSQSKVSIPYFIVGFVLAMLIATWLPQGEQAYKVVTAISRQLLVATLFLIGSNIRLEDLKKAGWASIGLASSIWILISAVSLIIIKHLY